MKTPKYTVALLSSGLGHVKRGVETWTDDMGRALAARGINVTVYKGGGKPAAAYERVVPCIPRAGGLSQWLIKHRPGFLWHFGFANGYMLEELTFSWALLPALLLRQFNIIHTQDPDVASFCEKLNKAGLIRSRVIFAHGTEEPFHFLKQFKFVQHLAPHHLEEASGNSVRNTKAFAIGNFVDTDTFKPAKNQELRRELNIPQDAFVVLSVAAIKSAHKRIDHLIREVSLLNDPNIYLVVAGSKVEETPQLIETGKKALGDRGIFLTDLPRERVAQLSGIADVFALCSLKEMMPIALLEALSSGLPCLVHTYPVEEWMIGAGGESLNMAEPGALGRVILKYRDAGYRREKSRLAREQAVKNFSKEVVVTQILKMYEDVL